MKKIFKTITALFLCLCMLAAASCGRETPNLTSEKTPEQASEKSTEKTPEETPEQSPEQTPDQSSELTEERTSEQAPDNQALKYGLEHVYATFLEETMDVSREVMELNGGVAEPMHLKAEFSNQPPADVYKILQMNGTEIKETAVSETPEFTFEAADLKPEWPVYLTMEDEKGERLMAKELAIRVHKGLMADRMPDRMGSEFGPGFKVDMDDLSPGMSLNVLPFMIPITVKTYADGAVRAGIGVNSSDVDFWKKAGTGQLAKKEAELASDLKELFNGDTKNKYGLQEDGMGLIVLFSGWAEGNVNTNDPIKGYMQLYIGTGFDVKGQYAIITWEIILTGGADGQFDFSYVYSEKDSEYHFQADRIVMGVKGGIELYGGVGCMLASVGAYGAASLTYQQEMYPDAEAEHLILAGEIGLKAKLLGKVLFSFTLCSGSHDFVPEKTKEGSLQLMDASDVKDWLLSQNYGDMVGEDLDTGRDMRWMGEDADEPQILNDWKARRDFSHLLAKDIYSENEVQIANTGSKALPQMQIVFLGSNPERGAGNRSTLMSSYYSLNKEFVSDPAPVWDDGTADFDPVMTASPAGWTYVVWKNALEPLEEGLSFSQIADKTELFIAEHQAGSSWYPGKQITNFSGTGKFAAGAKIGTDHDGEPVVVYYTNDISDPLGLNGTHEIYLASRRNGAWVSEKVTEITGTMNSVDCTDFGWGTAIAVSFEQDDKSYIALYRGTEKVWGREGASTAAFLGAGYRDVRLTWLQQGRLYQMAPDGTEKPLTPEDVQIPEGKYNLYGHIGNSSLMIVSTSLKDTSENAFAYYSKNGGTSWVKADLTDIDERASVSHISAAFTYENEPVLVYSVQHYDVNTDLDGLLEDPVAAAEKETGGTKSSLRFGNDDRFTDTRTDLYLKTRRMNSHAVLEDGKAENIENARLGSTLDFTVTVRNNGLYPIENGLILYKDSIVGMFHESIGLGESTEVHFSARLPEDAGDDLVMDFDLRTNEFRGVESTVSIPVDPGYLSVNKAAHLFTNGQESAGFVIENCGYSQKTCRIVAKDEAKDTVISEKTLTLSAGERRTESVDAENKLFVSDGCENVTVYILLGDEEPGDPKISPNRVFSFAPLEAVYGQSMEGLK